MSYPSPSNVEPHFSDAETELLDISTIVMLVGGLAMAVLLAVVAHRCVLACKETRSTGLPKLNSANSSNPQPRTWCQVFCCKGEGPECVTELKECVTVACCDCYGPPEERRSLLK